MNYLYGKRGILVGSREGNWIFDEHGAHVGTLTEGYLFDPKGNGPIGRFQSDILYDADNNPKAIGERPMLQMMPPLPPRLRPLNEKLSPVGEVVADVGPIKLREPFDKLALVDSLSNFGSSP